MAKTGSRRRFRTKHTRHMYDDNGRKSYEVRSRIPRATIVKKPSAFVVFIAVVLAGALLVGAAFIGAYVALSKLPQSTTTTVVYRDTAADLKDFTNIGYTGKEMTSEEVAAFAKQSVVEVVTESVTYAGFGGAYITSGAGSGVIISDSGHILTNYHVVEGAESITVTLPDGREEKVVWVMGDEVTDIAVIKINAQTENAAVIGSSASLVAGQQVMVVGNPLGDLGGSVSGGIISAVDRHVTIEGKEMNLIQLDAAVNPGNSGGGLFDMRGALVGIVNAKSVAEDVEGIGFAIPVDTAYGAVASSLMEKGYVEGRVDTSVLEFSETTGITISRPSPGLYLYSSSVKTDIPDGAYIVSVDGQKIKTIEEWEAILHSKQIGETVEIEYWSGVRSGTWRLTLTQRYDYDK